MRAFVLGAAALILAACATPSPPAQSPSAQAPLAQAPPPTEPRFDAAILAFEAADRENPPPRCATLFVGGSTIRFWRTLKQDFPGRTVINRGFGGSTVWEVDHYFDRVVTPYHPREIVFYAGDNDLGIDNRTPDAVYADFVRFMQLKDKALGSTPVWFLAVKPSKARWSLQPQMTEVNKKVQALAGKRNDLVYVDVVTPMLQADGTPKDIFLADKLHMTPEGYALWTPVVKASLDAGQKAHAPDC